MTTREAAALACRILGLYAWLSALGTLQFIGLGWMSLNSPGLQGSRHLLAVGSLLTSSVLPMILFTAAGFFLWIKADWLARRMTAGVVTDTETKIGAEALLGTAIGVVGLVVLVAAVPRACEVVVGLWLQARDVAAASSVMAATSTMTPDRADRMIVQGVTLAVQVALGLWLLLGAQGIAGFLQARPRGPMVEITR